MKNINFFYLKIISFLEVKFSIYLNSRVFVIKLNHITNFKISVKSDSLSN